MSGKSFGKKIMVKVTNRPSVATTHVRAPASTSVSSNYSSSASVAATPAHVGAAAALQSMSMTAEEEHAFLESLNEVIRVNAGAFLIPSQVERIGVLFRQLDRLNRGYLCEADFTDSVKILHDNKLRLWNELRSCMDRNGDGQVDQAEFANYFLHSALRSAATSVEVREGASIFSLFLQVR